MKFKEFLNEDKQLSEAIPKSKGANAFNQMANTLSGKKPNTMANAPVSASNRAKATSFGKGTAMPTKPYQVPGAGTDPKPKPAAAPAAKPAAPAQEPAAQSEPQAAPATANDAPADEPKEKNGLMYKMGKGIGDFGRGFKIGYGGRMPTDADVVPDEEPGSQSAGKEPTDKAGAASANAKEPSSYAAIKSNVDKLDKKGKQRILALLQKELGIAPTAKTPLTKTGANAPTAGAGAFGQMSTSLTSPKPTASSTGGQISKAVSSTVHSANPNNPNGTGAKPGTTSTVSPEPIAPAKKPTRTGGKVAGQVSQTPNAIRKRNARAAAKPVQNASVEYTKSPILESFSLFRKK